MAVKQVRSGARALAVFEAVALHQPVGVAALARALDDDKSAVQRALVTLAEEGWIRRGAADPTRWEVTTRMLRVSHEAYRRTGHPERTRTTLERLRDETGETVVLNVPEDGQVVVVDLAESAQLVRTVPTVGLVVPTANSAAGLAILAALDGPELDRFLGGPAGPELEERLAGVRERGWSINDRDATPGASAVGAALLDRDGRPVASLAISAPAVRMGQADMARLGPVVAAAAARLSARGPPGGARPPPPPGAPPPAGRRGGAAAWGDEPPTRSWRTSSRRPELVSRLRVSEAPDRMARSVSCRRRWWPCGRQPCTRGPRSTG